MNGRTLSRRAYLKTTTAATAMTALSYRRVLGANERVGIGVIGVGLMGRVHLRNFHASAEADVVAVSETHKLRLDHGVELAPGAKPYPDFRRLLEDKNVDAVVVATPDHWHALQTMMACAAGKDVYVEKPTTLFVKEGRWMLQVAERTKRVVQVGTQQRSGPHYQRARELIGAERIGKVVSVQCNHFRNAMPGFGSPPDGPPPKELDWEMFVGPAPARPYNPNRGIYHFRWFWDTSGGQMTNLGQHSLDLAHWMMNVAGPRSVVSHGGRHFLQDNGEVPDTQDSLFEFPGFSVVSQIREAAAGLAKSDVGGVEFNGTKGSMRLTRKGFEIVADKRDHPANIVANIIGAHPVGGPQPVPPPEEKFWTEPLLDETGDSKDQYVRHAANFLECVKNRRAPISDLLSGHQVATTCHLANIALRVGRKLRWDSDKEEIIGDAEASAMLTRPYRAPWDKELKALLA